MQCSLKSLFTTVVTAAVIVIPSSSCNKGEKKNMNEPIIDAQRIKINEVTIQGLPSPYFKFTYDVDNFITAIDHESGQYQYKVEYKSGRVYRMFNTAPINKDTLVYHYTGSNVTRIDMLEPGKGKTEETNLMYDTRNNLVKVTWKNVHASYEYKQLLITYNEQDNMSHCELYYNMGVGGMLKTYTYIYEGFDDKVNCTSNYLLKEFHYLFLPAVQLQRNNPIAYKVLGIDNDLEYTNSYQYNDSLPVLKTSLIKQTRGTGAGMSRTVTTRYSYY